MTKPVRWAPSRRVFLKRTAILTAFTFVVFAAIALQGAILQGSGPWVYLLVPAAMTAVFVIEDYGRWRRVRSESWTVEDRQLIHDSADGRAMIQLEGIERVAHRRWSGTVVLQLPTRQRVAMRYLADPGAAATHLSALIEQAENPLVRTPN